MAESDLDKWRDVDPFITYDKVEAIWHYKVPRPYGLGPVIGSSDIQLEARRTVAELVRDQGPARVIARRAAFGTDGRGWRK